MNFEEKKENSGPQNNEVKVGLKSSVQKELMQKTIEDCLIDSTHRTNELFELYDSIGQSLEDLDKLVKDREEELKKLKEKRFHIPRPISTYRLEEKIDIFEYQIGVYKNSFLKIEEDINEILESFYNKKIPGDEAKIIEDREKYFAMIYKDAVKELRKRKAFYDKIQETTK